MKFVLECTECLEHFDTMADAKEHEMVLDEEVCGDEYIVLMAFPG